MSKPFQPVFSIARLPRIEFGAGGLARLPDLARGFGRRILLVTGGTSLEAGPHWAALRSGLDAAGLSWEQVRVSGEPSPAQIDALVAAQRDAGHDCVIGLGGGSVLDAAKAVAGLLQVAHPVSDFLEGVGPELPYPGPALPFIAVPTTAGTGSEATKNAVLSRQGADGYKKSFRDPRLVPEVALVDPELLASCPPALIAANGMDALTQLLESYVSSRANPLTDALAISGLRAARDGLLSWYQAASAGAPASASAEARARMAYAALLSGINLAQTGLGSVHGLASPLGAFYPIPHGVVCGSLVAEATRINIQALQMREPDNPALAKYVTAAEILCERRIRDPEAAWAALIERLQTWTRDLGLPRLGAYGVTLEGVARVVAHSRGSSMQTNPIHLTDAEIAAVVEARL